MGGFSLVEVAFHHICSPQREGEEKKKTIHYQVQHRLSRKFIVQ